MYSIVKSALARRPSIQMRCVYAQMRFRLTPVDPNAFRMCSDALSLDARRSKCVSHMLKGALARRLSIQMHFLCARMLSPKASKVPMSFQSKKVNPLMNKKRAFAPTFVSAIKNKENEVPPDGPSYMLKCTIPSTGVEREHLLACQYALSLDARRSKYVSYVLRCALPRRL